MQYAKMAALDHPEALYKLGDMYARGHGEDRDLRVAWDLYWKSFEASKSIISKAQPAFRLAGIMGDFDSQEIWNLEYDPMSALEFYQLAERGLRLDIAQGQRYYVERLKEALEGQDRMRAVLEGGEVEG